MSVTGDPGYRRFLGKFKGGMMYYLGCHMIDMAVHFCGFPDEVIPMNICTGVDADTKDYGFCVLRYKNGLSFVKTCAAEISGAAARNRDSTTAAPSSSRLTSATTGSSAILQNTSAARRSIHTHMNTRRSCTTTFFRHATDQYSNSSVSPRLTFSSSASVSGKTFPSGYARSDIRRGRRSVSGPSHFA